MKYPRLHEELLALLGEDQREVRECSRSYRVAPRSVETHNVRDRFILRAQKRVERAIEILDKIGSPTIDNVGEDGSQAISVLALHARVSAMKRVLSLFEDSFGGDTHSVYFEAIPSLTDRILIIERKKQRYATQWMLGEDGNFFLPPVEDFDRLNWRRAAHGLGKSKHPIDLTYGVPKVEPARPYTRANDQRVPTEQEYSDFVYGSLE